MIGPPGTFGTPARMSGYEPEELLGASARDFLVPQDQSLVGNRLRSLIEGNASSIQFEHRLLHRDGHEVWVDNNITIERSPSGEPLHFHALTIGISERKEAEARLRDSEERANAVIKSLHEGLIIYTRDEVLLANDSASRILDIPRGTKLCRLALLRAARRRRGSAARAPSARRHRAPPACSKPRTAL